MKNNRVRIPSVTQCYNLMIDMEMMEDLNRILKAEDFSCHIMAYREACKDHASSIG